MFKHEKVPFEFKLELFYDVTEFTQCLHPTATYYVDYYEYNWFDVQCLFVDNI